MVQAIFSKTPKKLPLFLHAQQKKKRRKSKKPKKRKKREKTTRQILTTYSHKTWETMLLKKCSDKTHKTLSSLDLTHQTIKSYE
jgi:hypothetical protein